MSSPTAMGALALLAAAAWLAGGDAADPSTFIGIARSYVGVHEEPPHSNSNSGPVVDLINQGTKAAWCGYFVSYIVKLAGIGTRTMSSPRGIYNRARELGAWSPTPGPGAVFIHLNTPDGRAGVAKGWDHTGIVVAVLPDGRIRTIEGNAGDAVIETTRPASEPNGGFVPFTELHRVFS